MALNGWIKENNLAYIEGAYYKVNNAIFYRNNEVILRNTWTGNERVIAENVSKTKGKKIIMDFIRKNRAKYGGSWRE